MLPSIIALLAIATGALESEGAWLRLPPPGTTTVAGYVVFANEGDEPVVLTAAASDRFARAMFHATSLEDGMMRMRHLPSIAIEPENRFELAPGGAHLMLFDPVQPLTEGEIVPIRFETADGAQVEIDFTVRRSRP